MERQNMTNTTEKSEVNAYDIFDLSTEKFDDVLNVYLTSIFGLIRESANNGYYHQKVEIIHGQPYTKRIAEELTKLHFQVGTINEYNIKVIWQHIDRSSIPVR